MNLSPQLNRILAYLAVNGHSAAHPNQCRALHKRGLIARRDGSCPGVLWRKHITGKGWWHIKQHGLIQVGRGVL